MPSNGKDRDQVAWVPETPSITGSAPSHRGSGYSCRLPRTLSRSVLFCKLAPVNGHVSLLDMARSNAFRLMKKAEEFFGLYHRYGSRIDKLF